MKNILGMIGLAKRAGKLSCGEMLALESIKKRKSRLIIIAEDTSDNTKKSLTDSCNFYKVPYVLFSTKEMLGEYTGGGIKSVVSVNDSNFAKSLKNKIELTYRKDW